jgi:hypothetical protein
MSDEDIKALCMEWYLLYGERAVDLFCNGGPELFEAQLVKWINLDNQACHLGKLTPKALELIKGITNETKT